MKVASSSHASTESGKKKLIAAILIQGAGPVSILALSALITRHQGAEVQGAFAASRAFVDLLTAIGLFGLPQSIVLNINRENADRSALLKLAIWYSSAFFSLAALISMVTRSPYPDVTPSLYILIAATAGVIVGISRGIFLTVNSGILFSILTVSQTIIVATTCLIFLASGRILTEHLDMIFAFSGIVAAAICFAIVGGPIRSSPSGLRPHIGHLLGDGIDLFVVTVCASLQVNLCLLCLSAWGDKISVGHMSIALMLLNSLSFPIQVVSPILLNRWSAVNGDNALTEGSNLIIRIGLLLFGFSVVFGAIINALAPTLLFRPGESPPSAIWSIVVGVVPAFIGRITALRLAAIGKFRFNSKIAILQVAVFQLSLLLYAEAGQSLLLSAVFSWLTAESFSATAFLIRLKMLVREKI